MRYAFLCTSARAMAFVAGGGRAAAKKEPPAAGLQQKVQQEKAQQTQSGQTGAEEPSSHAPSANPLANAVFVNGALAVPDAPANTDTVPAKFSPKNAADDALIIVAYTFRTLTDEQRRAIFEALKDQPASAFNADVGTELPPGIELRPVPNEVAARAPQIPASGIWSTAFAGTSGCCSTQSRRLLSERHQFCLKPALRLLENSPVAVSLTEPVTLNGPPNSFCSALSDRSHLSSMLEMSAPNDTLVSVGRKLKRSAWLVAQLWAWPVAFGSDRVLGTPFCSVNDTWSPTGTERLSALPRLPCAGAGSARVSIAALSQPSGAPDPGAVMLAQPTPVDSSATPPA